MIRDGATDYLEAVTSAADIYRPVRARVLAALRASGENHVVDLCSGGGGPWLSPAWRRELAREGSFGVTLTDKFPSAALVSRLQGSQGTVNQGQLRYMPRPVDAAAVPGELHGLRTLFAAFHHFPDEVARDILRDAVRARDPVALAEVTSRSLRALITMLLMPVFCWVLTPRMRPFRLSRLLFTYLLPVIPLVVLFDGLVSCLRTRTPQELLALASAFPEYDWTAGYARGGWLAPVYLIGMPRRAAAVRQAG